MKKAAIVLISWRNKILLLQRREDDRSHPGGTFCFPGGSLDADDIDMLYCARRELYEETGLKFFKADFEPDGEYGSNNYISLFRINLTAKKNMPSVATFPGLKITISKEHQGYIWLDPDSIMAKHMLYAGPVTAQLVEREQCLSTETQKNG
jgi:8-oxo-dGTP pyrophosphatase MutT (NUDIX family)